jgi:hypothetical protein
MITKLEKELMKAMVYDVRKDTSYTFLSTKTANSVKISKSLTKILDGYTRLYNRLNKTNVGKSAYLHILVKKFRDEQPAIFKQENVDMKLFDDDVLPAIQIVKKILQQYVSETITGTNSVIIAIITYRLVRDYEIATGLPVEDYRDLEFKSGGDLEPEVQTTDPAPEVPVPVPVAPVPFLPELTPEDEQELEDDLEKTGKDEKEISIDDLFEETDIDLVRREK